MENEEKILKRYGFFGAPGYDYVIYLAGILCNLRKKVLVVDRTKTHQILSSFVDVGEEDEIFQYKHVDYTKSLLWSHENEKKYDYIFCYESESSLEEMKYDGAILFSDYQKENLTAASACAGNLTRPGFLVFRDACMDKFGEEYLIREYSCFDTMYLDLHSIPLDVIDYGYRLKMKYELYQGFLHLSKAYRHSLMMVVEELEQCSASQGKRAYQKAERGKYHGSRILE